MIKHCDKHGDYESYQINFPAIGTELESACPKCLVELEEKERQEKLAASGVELSKIQDDMGIPLLFCSASFDNYKPGTPEQVEALGYAKQIAANDLSSLVMIGTCGTGKTHLACAILNSVRRGKYTTMYEISARIRASYVPGAKETEFAIVDELATVPILVIDEMGRSKGSKAEADWLSYLINRRYADKLRTVFISNVESICDLFSMDILSRLQSGGKIVTLKGKDYRGIK